MSVLYALPLHTLRLWGRCVLLLLIWFTGGELGRYAMMVAASELSHGSMRQLRLAAVMLIFTLMVMFSLMITVGMLHSLRGHMTEIRARRTEGEGTESYLGGVGRTLIVFVGIYLAWDFVAKDGREFANIDNDRFLWQQDQQLTADLGGRAEAPDAVDYGRLLADLDWKIGLGVMIVAYLVRYVLLKRYERRGGSAFAIGAAFCELAFTFYGMRFVFNVTFATVTWIGEREVVVGIAQGLSAMPGWDVTLGVAGELWGYVDDVLFIPMTWLAVAILVYGAYAEDTRSGLAGTRLQTAAERASRAAEKRTGKRMRSGFFSAAELLGGDRWDKLPPLINAGRFLAHSGGPLFAMMCLCYVAIDVGGEYLRRGGYYLVGPSDENLRLPILHTPVNYVVEFLVTTLWLCLVAATFDLAATRMRETAPVPVSAGTAASSGSPGRQMAPGPHSSWRPPSSGPERPRGT